jgi:membrane dipeptidase
MRELYLAKRQGEFFCVKNAPLQINEELLWNGEYFAQCFAAFVPTTEKEPYALCKSMLSFAKSEILSSEKLSLVEKFSDFERNEKQGKISAILTMEDAAPIENSLNRLQEFYDLGVRMLGLTWNYPNSVGYPNFKNFKAGEMPDMYTPQTEFGLTEFGCELVLAANKMGIALDVSHLSDKGFFDVLEVSEKPIFASHSNARSLCKNVRNLSDDMLKKLADKGGVTGINYCAAFLNNDEEKGKKTVSCAVAHMLHIRKVAGIETIALGSDFDGIPRGIEISDASKMPLLLAEMERAGFSADEIDKITKGNALRVFKETMQ